MVANPQAQGWGPPCKVPKFTIVRADGLRLPVHRDIADLAALLIDMTELAGYDVKPGETWGGLCREVADGGSWSWHAWWMAIDLNAPSNPRATAEWHRRNARGTRPFGLALVCDIPERVIRLWEDYHFGWLGRAKSKPDPMHMQYEGTPQQARDDLARLRRWVADHGGTVPGPLPIPTPAPEPMEEPMYEIIHVRMPDGDGDGGKAFLVGQGKRRHLGNNGKDYKSAKAAGYVERDADAFMWQMILDTTVLAKPNSGHPGT